jgi:hypothetical protein
MEYKAKEPSPMNPMLAFGLFAMLIIMGAALLLYGLLQRPGRKKPDEDCKIVDDRLKPIVLDFQEPGIPETECILNQEPENILPMGTVAGEDHPDSTAADAISRLNEKFREMKELEAKAKKKTQKELEPELQSGKADSSSREEPEDPKIEHGEKKTLPDPAERPERSEQKGVSEHKGG